MKRIMTLLAVACGCLLGCDYEFPLTEEHTIPIDDAILGSWEWKSVGGAGPDQIERITILKRSDTEYTIHYSAEGSRLCLRGYPIQVGGIACLQLQLLEFDGDLPEEMAKRPYCVASCQLTNGQLQTKLLNIDLLGRGFKTSEELRKAFLKHKDSKELFVDPQVFTRVKK